MAQAFIYSEMNEVGKNLFGYELLPQALWPENDEIHIIPKTPIHLYCDDLDYTMFTSLYCHDYKDTRNDCPRCPFSNEDGCNDTPYEKVIDQYTSWRSVTEIVVTLEKLNFTRSHLVIAMLNRYIDTSYEKPVLYFDEDKGYNIDCIFYFGKDVMFLDSDIYEANLDENVIQLPFGVVDISDIVIPMAPENEGVQHARFTH